VTREAVKREAMLEVGDINELNALVKAQLVLKFDAPIEDAA
jgi:hypothetical protein